MTFRTAAALAIVALSALHAPSPAEALFASTQRQASSPDGRGAGWTMPWQLTPASSASVAQGEVTTLAYVAGYGWTRGTPVALRYLQTPLPASYAADATTSACRNVVAGAAAPFGAVRVEAALVGPRRRTPEGYEELVAFRILYARPFRPERYEVRVATLACQADSNGKIVDARAGS